MFDVVIVGAGVVGGMIARELSRYKLSLCILERRTDVAMGASRANSGIVHAGFDAVCGSLKAKMNVRGSELMPGVAKELGVHYKNNGSLVVAFSEEEMAHVRELYERGVQNGVKNLRVIDRDELRRIEPKISPEAVGALDAPTGGIICPYSLTIAAVGNAMDNGAVLKTDFAVERIEKTEDGWKLSSASESVEARYIVNAAGLYSDKVAGMAGLCHFDVHPRKGEYMILDRECGNLVSHTIFRVPTKMGKGILVSPTVDGNLMLGPTSVDMEDKENTETTQEGLDQITAGATATVCDIPLRSVITSFTGLRAVGSTHDFIIEAAAPTFINAAGIESPGLTSAPAIAEYVRDLLKENGLTLTEKSDFCPTRKLYRAPEGKYHKIVCRCETVSEGEILTAIRSNPPAKDIDGVKRRTRSGMGRCQGGFCMPFVAELLAREYGLPLTEITKCGGDSKLLVGKVKGC